MSMDAIVILICIVLTAIIWSISNLSRTHFVDDYFFRESIKNRTDFKYAKITPYYSHSYYVSARFGRDVYVLKERDFQSIYGAKVQDVADSLCWDLGLPKGSMSTEVVGSESILIKLKGGKGE